MRESGFEAERAEVNTLHHTHRDTHAGDSRLHKSSRGLHTPQALRASVRSTHLLYLARHDRIHLAVTGLTGEYSLPLFPREATQLLAPGLHTLGELSPIVLHYLCVCMCVRVFYLYPVQSLHYRFPLLCQDLNRKSGSIVCAQYIPDD